MSEIVTGQTLKGWVVSGKHSQVIICSVHSPEILHFPTLFVSNNFDIKNITGILIQAMEGDPQRFTSRACTLLVLNCILYVY